MNTIGVVVNPHAGGNHRRENRLEELRRIVGNDGFVEQPACFDTLCEVVRRFYEQKVDILAVCGGDGSFFRTLSAFVAVSDGMPLPRFLPLRAGSMNTIARGLGCPKLRPERLLSRVMAALRSGEPLVQTERALIRVNRVHYGFMTGAGTVVSFLSAYYDGGIKGPVGAAKLVGRLATSALLRGRLVNDLFRWVRGRVRCDEQIVPHEEFSVIYGANIADIGIGFRPTYRAGERNDRFHFLAGPVSAYRFLLALPRIYRGQPSRIPELHDALVERVEIDFQRSEPYMVDGDILEPVLRLTMEVGPVLRIVRGPATIASPSN